MSSKSHALKACLLLAIVVVGGLLAYWRLQAWQVESSTAASTNSEPIDRTALAAKVAAIEAEQAEARMLASTLVDEGEVAPHFKMPNLDGVEMDLPAPGKLTVINFFATWCGPCRAELPHLDLLWKELNSNDKVQFVVIGRGEGYDQLKAFKADQHLTLPFVADPEQKVFASYAREYIPRTLIVGPDGKVILSKVGYTLGDVDKFKSLIEQQLASLR